MNITNILGGLFKPDSSRNNSDPLEDVNFIPADDSINVVSDNIDTHRERINLQNRIRERRRAEVER